MSNDLRSTISDLASNFATAVVSAIRGASLEDILAVSHAGAAAARRGPGRPLGNGSTAKVSGHATPAHAAPSAAGAPRRSKGRLRRRSPDDIAKALAQVVALVKSKKAGLRAEQIRAALNMEPKEMPRILKEGLAKKVLKSKGQKRSTTYSAS